MSVISELAALAERRRTARLLYRRPAETEASARLVEPYQLLEEDNHLILRCWQVEPAPAGESGWRLLRVDRIAAAEDGGADFAPRCIVTLSSCMVQALEEEEQPGDSTDQYARYLEQALLDHRLNHDELQRARALAAGLLPSELRTVHGKVFSNIVNEHVLDQEVEGRDPGPYLGDVRDTLGNLGWAP